MDFKDAEEEEGVEEVEGLGGEVQVVEGEEEEVMEVRITSEAHQVRVRGTDFLHLLGPTNIQNIRMYIHRYIYKQLHT